ncbi:hypothetical protein R3P38DRAFT_2816284 [Favolaschia claudopus]|uniref:Uncharacterized protein n=1 Tax=Favolaschia claudopus TaxID=2862362 RepID=A0AAV9YZI5_9AGAR
MEFEAAKMYTGRRKKASIAKPEPAPGSNETLSRVVTVQPLFPLMVLNQHNGLLGIAESAHNPSPNRTGDPAACNIRSLAMRQGMHWFSLIQEPLDYSKLDERNKSEKSQADVRTRPRIDRDTKPRRKGANLFTPYGARMAYQRNGVSDGIWLAYQRDGLLKIEAREELSYNYHTTSLPTPKPKRRLNLNSSFAASAFSNSIRASEAVTSAFSDWRITVTKRHRLDRIVECIATAPDRLTNSLWRPISIFVTPPLPHARLRDELEFFLPAPEFKSEYGWHVHQLPTKRPISKVELDAALIFGSGSGLAACGTGHAILVVACQAWPVALPWAYTIPRDDRSIRAQAVRLLSSLSIYL